MRGLGRQIQWVGCAAILGACYSGGGGSPDAALGGPKNCPERYGPCAVSETVVLGAEADGFDLDGPDDPDGDGRPDNVLATSDALRLVLEGALSTDLANGDLRMLIEFRDFVGTGYANLLLVFYQGVDSDEPREPADDFTGEEEFYFDWEGVDLDDCSPKSVLESSYYVDTITGELGSVTSYMSALGGLVRVERASIEGEFVADTEGHRTLPGSKARFGGAITQCSLSRGAGTGGSTALHDLTRRFALQPDIDLDGDGLETVQVDSDGILSCTDGDGVTVVEGAQCACDERMADGFSFVLLLEMRGAVLLGPAPEPD